jgi:hypothetical protein
MSNESREALFAALRAADLLLARHLRAKLCEDDADATARSAAYDELMASLDACSAMPDSEQDAPGIVQRRVAATTLYKRTDNECEQALRELLRVEPELMRRVMSTLSSCRDRPTLLARYLPALIKELEAAVTDDFTLWRALTAAYEARAELEAPGSTVAASGPPDRRLRIWPW